MSIRNLHTSRTLPILAILALVLTTLPAAAQDWKGRGRIQGSVTGPDGNPVKGARVHILYRGQEGVGPNPVETNKKGRWAYLGLSSAPYTIVVEADGFVATETEVQVNEYATGGGSPVDVQLRSADSLPDAEGDRLMGLVNEGNRLMQERRFAEARAKFEEVIPAVEDAGQKRALEQAVAGTYLEEGNTAEARARFEPLLAATEDPAQKVGILQAVARSYYLENDVDRSVATLEQALALAPEDLTTLRRLVDTLLAAGREAEAEPYMSRLPEGEKIDADVLLNLGITAYNNGDLDTALEKFSTVTQAYPDNANAFYYLGLVQMGREQNAEALSHFQKMLELAPEHPNAAEARQFLEYLSSL